VSTVVALGEEHRVEGFALAGVEVVAAADAQAVRDAWAALAADVAVVILTPAAADALGPGLAPRPIRVVLP
jgi:vacuolar-type H+-ATPase subunit F/Vma7